MENNPPSPDKICPVCENKAYLASMDMTPELVEEMAAQEEISDFVGEEVYKQRLEICNSCPKLIGKMTCANCGCFVQFRARHKFASCIEGKW